MEVQFYLEVSTEVQFYLEVSMEVQFYLEVSMEVHGHPELLEGCSAKEVLHSLGLEGQV